MRAACRSRRADAQLARRGKHPLPPDRRRAAAEVRQSARYDQRGQTENRVKHYLTDDQICRLLCIGEQGNLFAVRTIQSMEQAHHERQSSHRAVRGGHSCGRLNYRCDTRDSIRAAGGVDRYADAVDRGAD